MSKKRSERRRRTKTKHKSRIKMWFRLDYPDRVGTASHQKDFEEFVAKTHWLHVYKSTAKPCSCQGCRNPRRSYWKHTTSQEKMAVLGTKEQIEELHAA